MDKSFFTYKGFPLVRHEDVIYYGNMSDDYVVMLKILNKKKVHDIDVASKIKSTFSADTFAFFRARSAALAASTLVPSVSAIRRSWIPVRVTIHSSLVSTTSANSSFVTIRSGT